MCLVCNGQSVSRDPDNRIGRDRSPHKTRHAPTAISQQVRDCDGSLRVWEGLQTAMQVFVADRPVKSSAPQRTLSVAIPIAPCKL